VKKRKKGLAANRKIGRAKGGGEKEKKRGREKLSFPEIRGERETIAATGLTEKKKEKAFVLGEEGEKKGRGRKRDLIFLW